MKKIKKQYAALLIIVSILSFQLIRSAVVNYIEHQRTLKKMADITSFHTPKEEKEFKKLLLDPIEPGETFLHSDNCKGCHGFDTAQYAMVTYDSVDVNIYDDWRSTMMANSARDPFWRAKVSHEILVNPTHADELQNTCTKCHAPAGNYSSFFKGNPFYTIADMLNPNDSLGLDGVTCTACHMIGDQGLGTLFSGDIPYDTSHVLYGPFTGVTTGPMQLYVGMTPIFSPHVSEGKMCSSCHTLLVNSVDLLGNPTGNKFVEQATYHEWVNSTYANDEVVCQTCHMPQTQDSVRIATGYFGLPLRKPFNEHVFQGSNAFMLKLMKENRTQLGINATARNFDSTIVATELLLATKTMSVDIAVDSVLTDTAFFTVRLTNRAGHKFPSGYPSRRAVLQFVVIGAANDTIFQSGMFDENWEVVNADQFPSWEHHYTVISSETQAQIYEMVPGDVNGDPTTLLERSDVMLKDNRIPPEGFTTTSNVYDTVQIVGEAFTDVNFNKALGSGTEGTGRDYVHFHVPINGYSQTFKVYSSVYYQALPPAFLSEMFAFNSAEIDTFRTMFNNADQSPYLVGIDSVLNITLGDQMPDIDDLIKVGPTPTYDGLVQIYLPEPTDKVVLTLYEANGKFVKKDTHINKQVQLPIELPATKGTYILDITFKGKHYTRKLLRN